MLKNLRAIAVLFVILGLFAWVDTLIELVLDGGLSLGLGLLLLPAGVGLMRENRKWLRFSRALVGLGAMLTVALPVLALSIAPSVPMTVFGETVSLASTVGILLLVVHALAYLGILYWMYRVLASDEVESAFSS